LLSVAFDQTIPCTLPNTLPLSLAIVAPLLCNPRIRFIHRFGSLFGCRGRLPRIFLALAAGSAFCFGAASPRNRERRKPTERRRTVLETNRVSLHEKTGGAEIGLGGAVVCVIHYVSIRFVSFRFVHWNSSARCHSAKRTGEISFASKTKKNRSGLPPGGVSVL